MESLIGLLQEKWRSVFDSYVPEDLRQLEQAYQEEHRHYHGLNHILDLLTKLEKYQRHATRPDLIVHAILWHDSVYAPFYKNSDGNFESRTDAANVEDSAHWFEKTETTLSPEDRARVALMIRSTSGHKISLPPNHPDFNDVALFLDLDLSSLALPYDAFLQNAELIRNEYPHLSPAVFWAERAAFLDVYRTKPQLFFHPVTAQAFDSTARENMRRLASTLRQQTENLVPRS